jgi:hypothetical protein
MPTSTPFPRQLGWYSAILVVASVSAVVVLGFRFGAPRPAQILLFGALVVFARHRSVNLRADVQVYPTTMIVMAAVVVFSAEGPIVGAVVVGMCAGIYVPSLTRGSWGWLPLNIGTQGLAATAAVVSYSALTGAKPSFPVALVAIAGATAAFFVVEQSLLLGSFVVESRTVPRDLVASEPRYVLELLPFVLLGFVLGRMYLSLGAAVMLLVIVPILIAREMFGSYMRVKESHEDTVGMLIHALEQKDHYTAGHAGRVANYAHYIGEELNFMPARLERLRFAALMHDIGKLVVPNHLLNKPGRLTAEEFAQVRAHEKVSVQMLSHIDFLRPIAGSGHSDNTRFNPDDPDHPIEPYIVMIADAYDAMTSTRAYRKALSQEVAFQELRDKAGIQFHPACVEALIGAIERRGEKHGAGHERQPEFVDAPATGVGSAGLGDLMPSEAV